MASTRPKRIIKTTARYNNFHNELLSKIKYTKKMFLSMLNLSEAPPPNGVKKENGNSKREKRITAFSISTDIKDIEHDFEGFPPRSPSNAILETLKNSPGYKLNCFEGFTPSKTTPENCGISESTEFNPFKDSSCTPCSDTLPQPQAKYEMIIEKIRQNPVIPKVDRVTCNGEQIDVDKKPSINNEEKAPQHQKKDDKLAAPQTKRILTFIKADEAKVNNVWEKNKSSHFEIVTPTNNYGTLNISEYNVDTSMSKNVMQREAVKCNFLRKKNNVNTRKRKWQEANNLSTEAEIPSKSKRLALSVTVCLSDQSKPEVPISKKVNGISIPKTRINNNLLKSKPTRERQKSLRVKDNAIKASLEHTKYNNCNHACGELKAKSYNTTLQKYKHVPKTNSKSKAKKSIRLNPISPSKRFKFREQITLSKRDEFRDSVKGFLEAGSEMVEIFSKTLQQQHETFLKSSSDFSHTSQNVVNGLAKLGDKIELEEMENLICLFDKEQEDRKMYKDCIVKNLQFSQQAHMSLYKQMSELLKTLQ